MAINVYITIDTEEDAWGEYLQNPNAPVDNVYYLPVLQKLLDKYGAMPTYLINYPVVSNGKARRILRKILEKGRCEIGTHCHPWNTPPFEEGIGRHKMALCDLPNELLIKKMEELHKTIIERLKVVPLSFRAGKWCFGTSVAQCIYDLGYIIDTSVSPFVDWTDEEGPDFSNAPTFPIPLNQKISYVRKLVVLF